MKGRRECNCSETPKFAVAQNLISLQFYASHCKNKTKYFLALFSLGCIIASNFKIVLGNDSVKFLEQSSMEKHLSLIAWKLTLH